MLAKYFVVFFYFFQTVVNATDETKGEATDSINSRLDALETSFKELVSKINQQQNFFEKLTEIELKNQNQLQNITTILANNTSQERCEIKPGKVSNESQPDARLLNVRVPSSVRARPDVWKADQTPEEDDLDKYMKNATGCEYMARGYGGGYKLVSDSPARGGRWRRRLAVRGEGNADIRISWNSKSVNRFVIGDKSNTETNVYDYIRDKKELHRETPGVMSQKRYTKFYYIQIENGVASFGLLGDSTPWWRQNLPPSSEYIPIIMLHNTDSRYGVKLLVCA